MGRQTDHPRFLSTFWPACFPGGCGNLLPGVFVLQRSVVLRGDPRGLGSMMQTTR